MSFVSVSEAGLLVGKSNPTIYRHIKEGKLSRSSNGKIDTTELIRVYGELRDIGVNKSQNETSILPTETKNEKWLKSQIESLQTDIKELKKESLDRESRLMALLENKQSQPSNEAVSVGGLFGKLFK